MKIMEQINNEQIVRLTEGLRKIDGFDFLVDSQFRICQTPQDGDHHQS
jgi:hypothetical protein